VLFHGISEPVFPLIGLKEVDALLETPVVSKTCNSSMSMKKRPLTIVRVELIPVSLMDQHRSRKIVVIG